MKILAIGDFHGTFPKKFESLIKKEKIDIVVSNGDYFPFYYRKLWFKHCYRTNKNLWEIIGKKKYKKLIIKDLRYGEEAIKKLNALPIPVITVFGNVDYTREISEIDVKKYERKLGKSAKWEWDNQNFFKQIIKKYKNIKLFSHSFINFQDYIFIGAYGGSNVGGIKNAIYKKRRKILDKLFKKFSKENKERKVIFVSHNVPYNTKLDKASMKAHPAVRRKHLGSKLIRRMINTYQPVVHVGGHMHESSGQQFIGKTLAINPGAAHEGKAAIITLEKNKKVKVKFIK